MSTTKASPSRRTSRSGTAATARPLRHSTCSSSRSAACAGYYALAFCKERKIPTEGLAVTMTTERGEVSKMIDKISICVDPPAGFPGEVPLRAVQGRRPLHGQGPHPEGPAVRGRRPTLAGGVRPGHFVCGSQR
ncbi:MAG: OsmC family protein [Ignavibacteriales bacterium]|nr:OsmC family protein [Ignavibacteriales bacterium]